MQSAMGNSVLKCYEGKSPSRFRTINTWLTIGFRRHGLGSKDLNMMTGAANCDWSIRKRHSAEGGSRLYRMNYY